MWTSRAALVITPEHRQALARLVRSGKTEQRIALRARIVLGAADGTSNNALATHTLPPTKATQWSCRSVAKICGVSKASVQRVWHANGFKPHLIKTFKLSNDPDFIAKLEAGE